MLAASLLGETSIATPSSVTRESLTQFCRNVFGKSVLLVKRS